MSNIPTGTVTFLFTDVEASTRRWEEHPTEMKDAMARHDGIVRGAIESNGGSVFTTAGDEFCAAFSSPTGALDAALAAQLGLNSEDWGELSPFRVRMAMHTGNADERDGDYFGPPLNRCARLLSTGHGGQVIVSAATAQLLRDRLSDGVELADLGAHELKDLDQPEHVFQVNHPGLPAEFPALRSQSPVRDAADLLAEGRQAAAADDWPTAYAALSAAAKTIDLDAEDLDRLGEAGYWTGHADEGLAAREQAYGAYVREGKDQQAALIAVVLSDLYKYRLAKAVSKAWLARAERLVANSQESEAYGYLLRAKCVNAFESEGDTDLGLSLADELIALGVKLGDRNLEALGLQDKGRFLVALGQIDDGMALIDEAMVAAVAGELSADATGRSYCNMLAVCDQVADYQRAAEWSDAAQRWCEQHAESAFPGVCRVFRAELRWLRGEWESAAAELNQAISELTGFTPIIGAALYQTGEIELRAGRFVEAEDHFRAAHEHGFTPLPGMAELKLQQDDPVAAEQLLADALAPDQLGPLARARLLPAWFDTNLALERPDRARDALRELEEAGEMCSSTAMQSAAAQRRGSLALSEDRAAEAIADLQTAIRGWTELQMPYEAAKSRTLLAQVQQEMGNDGSARMEAESAKAAFQRLGADADAERVDAIIGG
ncbi:MAG: adenylate/guanylate cyclase domain-containing protein [Acidimicrobiia bacterium]